MAEHLKPPSRLLKRLDAEIAAAHSPLLRDCKRLERACYLARRGEFEEARDVILSARSAHQSRFEASIGAWLNLSEGLIEFCSAMRYVQSRQKLLRAYSISSSAGLTDVQANSAAWMAHLDYLQENRSSMAKFAAEALRLSQADNAFARARASLVVAQAYHYAGRLDVARVWYEQVRSLAEADGDDLTVRALIGNYSGLRAQHLRFKEWKLGRVVSDSEYALISSESAGNFDRLIQATRLTTSAFIQQAQIYCSIGEYDKSLKLFDLHLDAALKAGMHRWEMDYRAEAAWCKLNVGNQQAALLDAIDIDKKIAESGSQYNTGPAHWRLSQIFQALEIKDRYHYHGNEANESLEARELVKVDMVNQLKSYDETRMGL